MKSDQALNYYSFTTKFDGLSLQLRNTALAVNSLKKVYSATALWDTGATRTCISNKVVKDLELMPTGKMDIHTPAGIKSVNTYLLDIILPNNVPVKDCVVCDSDIGNQGLDMLIGMDIISLGDFAVSNYNKCTVFSFRIPSKVMTDYVLQAKVERKIGTHGKGKRKRK